MLPIIVPQQQRAGLRREKGEPPPWYLLCVPRDGEVRAFDVQIVEFDFRLGGILVIAEIVANRILARRRVDDALARV